MTESINATNLSCKIDTENAGLSQECESNTNYKCDTCRHSSYCKYSICSDYCIRCTNCNYCKDCENSVDSSFCRKCIHCKSCASCRNCRNCQGSKCCVDCVNCIKCYGLHDKTDQVGLAYIDQYYKINIKKVKVKKLSNDKYFQTQLKEKNLIPITI